jgi:hypothetical protein
MTVKSIDKRHWLKLRKEDWNEAEDNTCKRKICNIESTLITVIRINSYAFFSGIS